MVQFITTLLTFVRGFHSLYHLILIFILYKKILYMPNTIKYSLTNESLALKTGNFWIGTGDVPKGPTSSSDYWNGITPPSGGYTIYLNKASQGPSIYTPLSDSDLVITTNMIAQTSFTSVTECFNWFNTQSDKMVFNIDYPPIITNGLVLNLDAGFRPSYSTSGTTWTDLSGNGNNGTLTNGPTFNSGNGGSIVFDNVNDYVVTTAGATPTLNITNSITIETWLMTTTLASAQHGDGVISKGISSDGNSGVYETLIVPSGGVNYPFFRMRIGAATPTYFPLNIPLTINQIFQFISTYDGSKIRIYVNSVEAGTGLSASGTIEFNTQELAIGIRYNHIVLNPRDSYFGGRIYNCKIYNRALSATEILQNYNATKSRYGL